MRKGFRCRRQQGVTMIEVLVGFVIFMSSLVAVLDYVGNQAYLERVSQQRYQAISTIQQQLMELATGDVDRQKLRVEDRSIEVRAASVINQESIELRRIEHRLQRIRFVIRDDRGERNWTVLDWR